MQIREIRLDKTSLAFLFVLSVSCTTVAVHQLSADVRHSILDLVKAHDFDGARGLFDEKSNSPWCMEVTSENSCKGDDVSGRRKTANTIKYSEECFRAQAIADSKPLTRSAGKRFLEAFEKGNECKSAETIGIENQKLANLAKELRTGLEMLPTAATSQYAISRNKCLQEGVFRYWVDERPAQTVRSQAGNASLLFNGKLILKGTFGDQSACDEARLIDAKASTIPPHDTCAKIYTGATQTVAISKLKFMYRHPSGKVFDNTIRFVSREKCEGARATGLQVGAENEGTLPDFIGGAGEKSIPRFIGPCEIENFVVCSKNSNEVHSPESLIISEQ